MHRLHSALTVAVPIKKDRSNLLRDVLKRLQPVKPNSQGTNSQVLNSSSGNNRLKVEDSALLRDQNPALAEEDRTDQDAGERNLRDTRSIWPDISQNTSERNFIHWGTNNTPSAGQVIISGRNNDSEPVGADLPNTSGTFVNETQGQTGNLISTDSSKTENKTIAIEGNANTVISGMFSEGKKIDAEFNHKEQPFNFDACDTILFVTGVILPSQDYGNKTLPATLVFATTYVGSLSDHLKNLLKCNRDGLCEMLKHCVDFPEDRQVTDQELINYIKHHSHRSAFNSRYSCITKQDVKREKELRIEIEDYLDKANDFLFLNGQHPKTVKKLIQRHIRAQGDKFRWAQKREKDSVYEMLTKKRLIILPVLLAMIFFFVSAYILSYSMSWLSAIIVAFVILISIVLVAILILISILYFIARKKNLTAGRPPDDQVRLVAATQLRPIINEMTAAAPMKKGWLRRHFYSFALRVVNLGCHQLMQIPTVSSIRWLSIDNKKRLLFLSNYSNTTDFYVREFLTGKTPLGVNFMFTNGSGFPDATLLRFGGIKKDPEGYMNVIHTHQHAATLWYSHEYDLTIDQILRNRKLRNGLFKKMNKEDTTTWLQLL